MTVLKGLIIKCTNVLHSGLAGRACTGPGCALVVAGRSVTVITGHAVGQETVRWTAGAGAEAGLGHVTGPHR